MGIAEQIGGVPALAAGVRGDGHGGRAVGAKYPLFDGLGVRAWRSRGFALGAPSRTVRAARPALDADARAYAGIAALGLQVLLASLLMPLVFPLAGLEQ